MWTAAKRLGFKGGSVLEPGMGIGHFAGLMPPDVQEGGTTYHGIEMDAVTADIAKLLYPKHGIKKGDFTRIPLPENSFDLAIGNPPFADVTVRADKKYAPHKFLLHDYFFAKSLDSVRAGGLVAFISSAGTMNKQNESARQYMADRADLIGAIRLPSSAFAKNAGTEVTTDIIFLRKREEGAEPGDQSWVGTEEVTLPDADGNPTTGYVNRYFVQHPEMVLGEPGFFDKLYKGRYAVRPRQGEDLGGALAAAVDRLPEGAIVPPKAVTARFDADLFAPETKDGSYYQDNDGNLRQYRSGAGTVVERRAKGVKGGIPKRDYETVTQLLPIRDSLRDVMRANLRRDDAEGREARAKLNEHYDAFVEKNGPLNLEKVTERRPTIIQQETARQRAREAARMMGEPWYDGSFDGTTPIYMGRTTVEVARARQRAREEAMEQGVAFDEGSFSPADMPNTVIKKYPNLDPFKADPEVYRLAAMERANPKTGQPEKGPVFDTNILADPPAPTIRDAKDSMLHVMNAQGQFDVDETARVLGKTREETIEELGPLVYRLPGTDLWHSTAEYLSGDVKTKLEEAQKQAATDPSYQRNVDALQDVIPEDLVPSQIEINLGAPWVPMEFYEAFAEHIGLRNPKVTYNNLDGRWGVSARSEDPASRVEWGSTRAKVTEIFRQAVNRAPAPKHYDDIGHGERVLNRDDTAETQLKYDAITEEFDRWIRADPKREETAAENYNEKLRRFRDREFDGSYLTTPGVAKDWQWRPFQLRVIARIIATGNTYMAHAVGAGKTSAMIGAAMEMRRLGIAKKPLFIVPNAMLRQFTTEWLQQYPTANIMVADEESFHTSRRKQFVANAALDDTLDGVIMTHDSFGLVPISAEFEASVIQEEIDQYRAVLREMEKEDDVPRQVRSRMQKQIESLEQRLLDRGKSKQDETFNFEEMGVDQMFVDEAQVFRKLGMATSQGTVKGIDPQGNNMTRDLYTKVRYMDTIRKGPRPRLRERDSRGQHHGRTLQLVPVLAARGTRGTWCRQLRCVVHHVRSVGCGLRSEAGRQLRLRLAVFEVPQPPRAPADGCGDRGRGAA